MAYELRPLGCYEYVSASCTIQEALERLLKAQAENIPVVCQVINYDETTESLSLEFHGFHGIIKKGFITQNTKFWPKNLVGKTTKIRITNIHTKQNEFYGERLSVENEVRKQLRDLRKGDLVEGVTLNTVIEKSCAFVDIMEGYCAYLPLFSVTPLPDTCCSISEFIKIGERIKLMIVTCFEFSAQRSAARVCLANPLPEWEEAIKNISVGDIYEGKLKVDRKDLNTYYMSVNESVCVRITSLIKPDLINPAKVRITNINHARKTAFGAFLGDEPTEPIEENQDDEDININEEKLDEFEGMQQSFYFGGLGSLFERKVLTTISPFAIRENETKNYESDPTKFSKPYLEARMKLGHFTHIHIEILKTIRVLGYCTNKQIMSYFFSHGISIQNQDKLNNRLESMIKLSLINRIQFTGEDGGSNLRVYSLSDNGYWTLRNMFREGKEKFKVRYIVDSVERIKRMLASNQFALMCKECIPSCGDILNQSSLIFAQDASPVRPTGFLPLNKSTLVLEGVRRPIDDDKLSRYITCFQDFDAQHRDTRTHSFMYENPTYLILICEDEQHAREVYSKIAKTTLMKRTYFTYDLLIYQGSPSFALFRFDGDGMLIYLSIPDLVERNEECFTNVKIDGLIFKDCTFNSFPEQHLRNTIALNLADKIHVENITVHDSHQNTEYLYLNDYEGFFVSSEMNRKKEAAKAVWEPRVFFLGSGDAGKTSVIKALAGQCFNERERKTNGVQVFLNLWENLPWMRVDDIRIDHINVWDFAGQEYDHAFNSFLMTESALYILVLDARREDSPDDWLYYIQTYAPRSKVMLVINKLDTAHPTVQQTEINKYHRINIAKYREMFTNIVGVYQTSCEVPDQPGNELETLKHDICKQILAMESQFKIEWPPEGSQELRDWLRTQATKNGYIMKYEFDDKCDELGLDNKSNFILNLCARSGLCIYNQRMDTYIVLNPQWLTYGIAKILKSHNFSETKWKLSKREIIAILEDSKPSKDDELNELRYKNRTSHFLQILNFLGLCIKDKDDTYIFPCFLPYPIKREGTDALSDMSGWYERQTTYKILPPEVFPELQGKLWAQQWNKKKPEKLIEPSYEPDRGRIVFIQNDKKMVALKEKNTIVLAVERENPNAECLTFEEKQAMRGAREQLKKLHDNILERHHLKGNGMVKEQIILKGRRSDLSMQRLRYPYDEENLKKICMAGVAQPYYFPEVDQWYNAAGLLLEEYDDAKILKIYNKYLVHIFTKAAESDKKINIGTGFLTPYIGNWYIICCAHEINVVEFDKIVFETAEGYLLTGKLIKSIHDKNVPDCDIAIISVLDTEESEYAIPADVLSFRRSNMSNLSKNIYCKGYSPNNALMTVSNISETDCDERAGATIMVKANEVNEKLLDGQFVKGFSGAPMLDIKSRCIFGMLREINGPGTAAVIPIEKIWRFIENSANE